MARRMEKTLRQVGVFLSAVGLCVIARAGVVYDAVRIVDRDDFERAIVRKGNPEIVAGVVSDGLMTATRQAVYRTKDRLFVVLPNQRDVRMPVATGEFFRVSFRLYSFTPGTELSFRFATTDGARAKRILVDTADEEKVSAILPADVSYVVGRDGVAERTITSLVNGTVNRFRSQDEFFAELNGRPFKTALAIEAPSGRESAVKIDEHELAVVRESRADTTLPPFDLQIFEHADTMKKSWKLVFEDEFDGPEGSPFDPGSWYIPGWRKCKESHAHLDGKGHLAIKCDYDPAVASTASTNLQSTAVWSRQKWQYGYFEARLRFTKNNGWWAAFWLYGQSDLNPVECGSEIDIFEDYHTRYPPKAGLPPGLDLDHNLHFSYGSTIKSYNHTSYPPGSLDEFHTIGCKWTPFEISIYVDGKLLKSTSKNADYPTVTFDSFRQNALSAPLHIVFSGDPMKTWGNRDTTGFVFPEYFLIDSVRVWAYPHADEPQVRWRSRPKGGFVDDGFPLAFDVDVTAKDKVKAVYLFDNGAYIACRTQPPWSFSVPFSRGYYEGTHFLQPGRQKKVPEWEGFLHSFEVYAQDENGRVGLTPERVRIIPAPAVASTPRNGKPARVPGRIAARDFDEGGHQVAYWGQHGRKPVVRGNGRIDMLHTGEWLKYTVDVERNATYRTRIRAFPCFELASFVQILVDGVCAVTVPCATKGELPAEVDLPLPKGCHCLTVVPLGYLFFEGIDFQAKGTR